MDSSKTLDSDGTEKLRMQNEFNVQRAKMKELFMQKELELKNCEEEKQRLLLQLEKAQILIDSNLNTDKGNLPVDEEILSLQQLVQDTINESAIYKAELDLLSEERDRLLLENQNLRQDSKQPTRDTPSRTTPHMLTQVRKTLARKLGGETINASSLINDSENSAHDGSTQQYANEDSEVLRSITIQLQEEMKVLKQKLREADEQLQAKHAPVDILPKVTASNKCASTESNLESCSKCASNEKLVNKLEDLNKNFEIEMQKLRKNQIDALENLKKEVALRKGLEEQWQHRRESHKSDVKLLREQISHNELGLLDMQQIFLTTRDNVMRQLEWVISDRDKLNKHLATLQNDNDYLSGRYLETSQEIDTQEINMPDTIPELHELCLGLRENLILARVSSEFQIRERDAALNDKQKLLDQLKSSEKHHQLYKKKVEADIKSLQDRLSAHLLAMNNFEAIKKQLEQKVGEIDRQMAQCRVQNIELQEANEKLQKLNVENITKIKTLQDELENSEQVQKDFVKLSQTLQISLEELRHADTEVRWQEDDDVDNCPSCSTYFTVTVRKIHCRHCGHIYCDKCLTKTVPSGPRKRNARVCDICHTLLQPNTAPYFSQEPTKQH